MRRSSRARGEGGLDVGDRVRAVASDTASSFCAAHDGVDVAVEEAGNDGAAAEIDHLVPRPMRTSASSPKRQDALARDRERPRPRPLVVERHDLPAPQDEVGGDHFPFFRCAMAPYL